MDSPKYTRFYYLDRNIPEINFYKAGILRPDQLAALCYMFGYTDHKSVADLFNFDEYHPSREVPKTTLGEQLSKIEKKRTPLLVLSIGSGRGGLEAALTAMNVKVIGSDPSLDAQKIYSETLWKWTRKKPFWYSADGALSTVRVVDMFGFVPDTVVFDESLEHISAEEIIEVWKIIKKWKPLVVVTNWVDYFPIETDGDWHHITRIDQDLYDDLKKDSTWNYQVGSHLVLQY